MVKVPFTLPSLKDPRNRGVKAWAEESVANKKKRYAEENFKRDYIDCSEFKFEQFEIENDWEHLTYKLHGIDIFPECDYEVQVRTKDGHWHTQLIVWKKETVPVTDWGRTYDHTRWIPTIVLPAHGETVTIKLHRFKNGVKLTKAKKDYRGGRTKF